MRGDLERGEECADLCRRREHGLDLRWVSVAARSSASGRLDPVKLVPRAPNSATALRMMIDRLLAVSQGIPLPDARAVKGKPFREFASLRQYEREILHAS